MTRSRRPARYTAKQDSCSRLVSWRRRSATRGAGRTRTTPGPNAPIIFLVCGSFPGGSAGVWGRSLCVNATLREGGMFDYIERCRNELGANVVVADPNVSEEAGRIVAGSETPHRPHLSTLYSRAIHKDETRPIAIVAHRTARRPSRSCSRTSPSAVLASRPWR